jgi:hypothetical protein
MRRICPPNWSVGYRMSGKNNGVRWLRVRNRDGSEVSTKNSGSTSASCRRVGAWPPRRGHLHPIKPKTGLMGTPPSGPTRAVAKLQILHVVLWKIPTHRKTTLKTTVFSSLIRLVVPSPFRTRAATFSLLRGRLGCGRFWGRAVTRGSLPTQCSRAEAW